MTCFFFISNANITVKVGWDNYFKWEFTEKCNIVKIELLDMKLFYRRFKKKSKIEILDQKTIYDSMFQFSNDVGVCLLVIKHQLIVLAHFHVQCCLSNLKELKEYFLYWHNSLDMAKIILLYRIIYNDLIGFIFSY